MRNFGCLGLIFAVFHIILSMLCGEEFSPPREFSEFESNLGDQQLVEVVRPWVGKTPQEIAPGSIPLGSLRNKTYVPVEVLKEEPEPLLPVESPLDKDEFANSTYEETLSQEVLKPDSRSKKWVGPSPQELAPNVIPLGALSNRSLLSRKKEATEDLVSYPQEKSMGANLFFSTRPYFTSNVLRTHDGDVEAGVWENLVGASIHSKSFALGEYITMVPKLDLIAQFASYEDKDVASIGTNLKELLDYRFSLVKAGLTFDFPKDYSFNIGYEYNLLNSLDTGKQLFDSYVPSFRLSKILAFGDTTFLMLDGSGRYSKTDRALANPLPGQFPDDGDNFQVGLNIMLIKLFGSEGQFMVMPSLNFSRSEYLNHENDGRVDWLTTASITGSWQVTSWLVLDLGLNFSLLRMNDKGEFLLGESSKYEVLDIGGSAMVFHTF
jgi:hypothetical protein